LPVDAGIGLKPEFFAELDAYRQQGLWFEIHAIHGVGASLGSPEPVCQKHLQRIRKLCDRVPCAAFSEHIAWSSAGGEYYSNLMPVPRTKDSVKYTAENIMRVQDALGRSILVENPANYIELASEFGEADYLMELVHQTQCGLLLDVNNLFISGKNINIDIAEYIRSLDSDAIGEIHIAGHTTDPNEAGLLIDSHDQPEYFRVIARAYVESYTPDSKVLASYGKSMPEFIGTYLKARLDDANLDYVSDLAELDSLWDQVYFAKAEPEVSEETLEQWMSQIDSISLSLNHNVMITSIRWSVLNLWAELRHEALSEKHEIAPEKIHVLMWRGPNRY